MSTSLTNLQELVADSHFFSPFFGGQETGGYIFGVFTILRFLFG
jgi:hypothetical protein